MKTTVLIGKLAEVSKELEAAKRPDLNDPESYFEDAIGYLTLQRQQLELMAALIVQTYQTKDYHAPIVHDLQSRVKDLNRIIQGHHDKLANLDALGSKIYPQYESQ